MSETWEVLMDEVQTIWVMGDTNMHEGILVTTGKQINVKLVNDKQMLFW